MSGVLCFGRYPVAARKAAISLKCVGFQRGIAGQLALAHFAAEYNIFFANIVLAL